MKKTNETGATPIIEFCERLVVALDNAPIPVGLGKEDKLERQFVLLEAQKVLDEMGPHFDVCAHPWNSRERCPGHKGTRKDLGCWQCWKESKSWASVHVWGMQHNFDLAVRDRDHVTDSLVVEGKLVSFLNGQPNGEIQRFFGQCALARTKHKVVIGFCGYRGTPREKWRQDTEAALRWFNDAGIRILFRQLD